MTDHFINLNVKGHPKKIKGGSFEPPVMREDKKNVASRRFCILDVGDRHIQDKGYFGAIMNQMENGGYAAMLYDLQKMELSDFNIREVPDSEGLREQKILSMDPITAWWFQKLKEGSLPSEDEEWGIVDKNAMYEDYAETIGKAGVIYRGMQTTLAMKLKKLLPGQYPISIKKKVVVKEYLEGDRDRYMTINKRIPHWQFPSLKECREHFEKIAKMKGYNWPDEPEVETEEEKPMF